MVYLWEGDSISECGLGQAAVRHRQSGLTLRQGPLHEALGSGDRSLELD